jgi:hypothetical protein
MIMNDYMFIVTGHLNNKEKEKRAIQFIKKLKKRFDYPICYATHSSNLPQQIIDDSDYLIYTKQNPILNWDIRDNWSARFRSYLNYKNKQYIMPLPIASYAMHLSVCDAILLGINEGFTKFHYFNSDVDDIVFDKISLHEELLKDNNVVHQQQNYLDDTNIKIQLNAEFKSFDIEYAKVYYQYKNYEKIKELCDPTMESYYGDILLQNKQLKYKIIGNKEYTTFGAFGFNTNCVQENSYFKYDIDDGDGIVIPYKENNEYKIIFENSMNKEFIMFINDEKIIIKPHDNKIVKFDIPAKVRIYHKDKEYNNCIFKNDLQFGYVIEYEHNQ